MASLQDVSRPASTLPRRRRCGEVRQFGSYSWLFDLDAASERMEVPTVHANVGGIVDRLQACLDVRDFAQVYDSHIWAATWPVNFRRHEISTPSVPATPANHTASGVSLTAELEGTIEGLGVSQNQYRPAAAMEARSEGGLFAHCWYPHQDQGISIMKRSMVCGLPKRKEA